MIGPFRLEAPNEDDETRRALDQAAARGTPYGAVVMFGLPETSVEPALRRAAGYRHLADHPGDGPIWLEVARLHADDGEIDAALAILDELERLGAPGLYPGAYLEDLDAHRAHLLADAERFAAAHPVMDRLEEGYGDAIPFRHLRASVLQDEERYEEAVAAYAEALALLEAAERDEDAEDADFAALREYFEARKLDAEAGKPFVGRRALILTELVADPDSGDLR